MDRRAIGVFDSGLGGLTAARVLERILPYEDIIYFGDTANMPYGPRNRWEIEALAINNARFLASRGVKAILVACGTVSANAMDALRENFDIPFFGVVEAAARAAAEASRVGRVGVIATQASIKSGIYPRRLSELRAGIEIIDRACPSFVPLVESGHFRRGDSMARTAVEMELRDIKRAGVDALLLGCTHFPLLGELIADYMGEGVKLISSGAEAAASLALKLGEQGLLTDSRRPGRRQYFTSGDAETFSRSAEIFLGHRVEAETV